MLVVVQFLSEDYRQFLCLFLSQFVCDELELLFQFFMQGMAYEPILRRNSCIIADQSGSGKTLAYLAPSIQYLVDEELQGIGKPKPGCPRMVILVPTSELASQVRPSCGECFCRRNPSFW